jgi:hypothetical protein
VAGHSPNEAEKLVLGPGHLDMTSKRTSSADGSVEPAFARRTLTLESCIYGVNAFAAHTKKVRA